MEQRIRDYFTQDPARFQEFLIANLQDAKLLDGYDVSFKITKAAEIDKEIAQLQAEKDALINPIAPVDPIVTPLI